MKQFKDLGIKATAHNSFVGTKVQLQQIVDHKITVHKYIMKVSKFKGNYMKIQISLGSIKHVIFTSYASLVEVIEQVPEESFPFETTIIKVEERYQLS